MSLLLLFRGGFTPTQYARSAGENLTLTDTAARSLTTTRAVGELASSSEVATRVATLVRRTFETPGATTDVASRLFVIPRTASDATAVLDVAARTLSAQRTTSDLVQPTDSARRSGSKTRVASELLATPVETAIGSRAIARSAVHYFVPTDPPVTGPTKAVRGYVRNADGTVYTAGAMVYLIRDSDGLVAQTQTSATDGSYVFLRNAADPETYHVEAGAIVNAAPQQGTTPRGLVPA